MSEVLRMPSRVFRAWLAYLDIDMDEPGKTEWYLLKLRQTVAETSCRKQLGTSQFILKFKKSSDKQEGMSVEEASALAKAAWSARLGVDVTKTS